VSASAPSPPGPTGAPGASLLRRLLLSASIVLAVFVLVTGLALDRAFRESAYAAVEDRLKAAVYMLLGATVASPGNTLSLPEVLPDPRLVTPESGFYAEVVDAAGRRVWRSKSAVGTDVPYPGAEELGAMRFVPPQRGLAGDYFTLSYGIAWEFGDGEVAEYEYRVAEHRAAFDRQITGYRRELWGWLAALAAGLLLVQAAVLRWGLSPLRRVADEIRAIEAGERGELSGGYPAELQPLTVNLNRLIGNSQSHLQRYRHALADLAHSLKTPLAVLRGINDRDAGDAGSRALMAEQLERMDKTIDYQLQRAAASGRTALTAPVRLRSLVERLTTSLDKVYRDKAIDFRLEVDAGHSLHCDEGDLTEMLGNLLDNACKWAASEVSVRSAMARRADGGPPALVLEVADDGPGIPDAQKEAVLARGARADARTEGQGIGLAVVRELAEQVYGGSLELLDNAPRGARIRVTVPWS